MLIRPIVIAVIAYAAVSTSLAASQSLREVESEGRRDGLQYAKDMRKHGITPDGISCAVGMAAEDGTRPHYTQEQIEAYAKAFGNACVGRKVL